MKKFVALLLATVFLFSLAACSSAKKSEVEKNGDKVKETEKADTDVIEETEETIDPDSVDYYGYEDSDYGAEIYYSCYFNENDELESLSIINCDKELSEEFYSAYTLYYSKGIHSSFFNCKKFGIDFVEMGFSMNKEENTAIMAIQASGLDKEGNFQNLMGAIQPFMFEGIEELDGSVRDNVALLAEENEFEKIDAIPDIEIPSLVSIESLDDSCWLCFDTSADKELFESWDVELCDDCRKTAQEYDSSMDYCEFCYEDTDELIFSKYYFSYLCNDCYEENTFCRECGSEVASFRDKHLGYYCDGCYGDGEFEACSECFALEEELFALEAYDDYFVCSDCYGTLAACVVCGSVDSFYTEEIDEYICNDCYGDGEGGFCDRCCEYYCELFKFDHDESYYLCDGCYRFYTSCVMCYAEGAEYREEIDNYLCNDCYGLGINMCAFCYDYFSDAIYDENVGDYFCNDCYDWLTECECGSSNTAYYEIVDGYYCADCYVETVICKGVGCTSMDVSYRDEYYEFYCDECYGDGTLEYCCGCDGLFEEVIFFEYYPGDVEEYYCADCYAELSQCYICGVRSDKNTYDEKYEEFYCKSCRDDGVVCRSCDVLVGELFYSEYYGGKICSECCEYYEEVSKCCGYCGESGDDVAYREDIRYRMCDSCYQWFFVCKGCYDESKETDYRSDYDDYYCDDCYVEDGDMCSLCGRLVDYELHEWTEEDFLCDECYHEWLGY